MLNHKENSEIIIRSYQKQDREIIRRINYETSFLQKPHLFFDDAELVTDALTRYYLEFEPSSCFVAEYQDQVVGYIIGTLNLNTMNRTYVWRIGMPLVFKAIMHGVFFKKKTMAFVCNFLRSYFRGEFHIPNLTKEYPSTFHINVDRQYQGHGVGSLLIQRALKCLKENHISGVQFSTMTDESRDFFMRQGFQSLFSSRRTFLKYALGHDTPYHLLGLKISVNS